MKLNKRILGVISFIPILMLHGCGGGGGGGGTGVTPNKGTAPVISDLYFNPVSFTVNENIRTGIMVVEIAFNDPDGDLNRVRFTTSNGDDLTFILQGGSTSGTIRGEFGVATTQIGLADFDVWVVDSNNNDSNVLSGTFSITQDLDITFGQNGIVIDDDAVSGMPEDAHGVALQADGKIVVVGYLYNGWNNDVRVQRYNSDGLLDSTFATNGSFIFDSDNHEIAYAVAMQPDGKIVVVGYIREFNAGNENVLVMRLNADGTLDTTFGANGIVTTNVSDYGEYGYAVTIQPDGKLVVAGEVSIGGTDVQALVLRYNSDGGLDGTFGNSGIFQYSDPADGWDKAYGVTLQADGKVVVTGSTSTQSALALTDLLVLRLNTDGTLDNTFGNGGVVLYDDIYESGRAVLVLSDGRIVVGGTRWDYVEINDAALILRLNGDGTLDNTFGQDGVVIFTKEYCCPTIAGQALAISGDGKIVLVGKVNTDILVIRVISDGSYDTTFSVDGISAITSGGYAMGNDVVLQSDGSIIAVGNSTFHDQHSDEAVFLAKLTGQ
jgi:uncharacterized delta-60 repeat protein